MIVGFSSVFDIAAAAAVHELVTKDNDKTNDITTDMINSINGTKCVISSIHHIPSCLFLLDSVTVH
jgi:hypothetical protein